MPRADEENLQALRETMKAVKDGHMGTQNVNAIWHEVMGNDAVPTAPSVQTQPLDTANELSRADKGEGVASSYQAESIHGGSFFDDEFDRTHVALEDPTVDGSTFENNMMALIQAQHDRAASVPRPETDGDTAMVNGYYS